MKRVIRDLKRTACCRECAGIPFLLLTMSLICVLFFSCKENIVSPDEVRPVKVSKVRPYSVVELNYTGVVTPKELVNLAFRMGGPLIGVDVVEGTKVNKGDIIARIDLADYSLDMEAKKATYITASQQMERAARLLERNALSKQDYESMRASYENARATYENSLAILEQTTLKAPFSGFIQEKYVENYQEVTPGQKIVCLINPNKLQMQATLPDRALSYITSNPRVYVEFEAYKGERFEAAITEYVQSSPNGSGIPVFVEITDPSFNLDRYRVAIGFSCTIGIQVDIDSNASLMLVPLTAVVQTSQGNNAVFLYVPQEGIVRQRIIEVGEVVNRSYMVVKKGVSANDLVVSAGALRLKDGERVRIFDVNEE